MTAPIPRDPFRTVVETTVEGIWTFDREGATTFTNEAMAAMLDALPAELLGRSMLDFVPSRDAARAARDLMAALDGRSTSRDSVLRDTAGHERPVRFTLAPLHTGGPGVSGVLLMVTDLSELRQAEQDLSLKAHLLDSVGEAVIACDLDGRLRYFNPSAEALLHWTSAHIGQSVFDALEPEDVVLARRLRDEVLHGGASVNEIVVRHEDRSTTTALLKGALVRDERGEPSGIIAVLIDLEERRKAEEQATRRAAEQAAAARLSDQALRDAPLSGLLDDATRTLSDILQVDHATVFLFDDEVHGHLRLISGFGCPPEDIGELTVPIFGSVAGQALTQRAPVVCGPSAAERFPASGAFFRGGIETTMVCVIEGQDQALGVIGIHSRRPRVFTHDDEMFVLMLGNVIAAAIMRERAERALQDAEEAERRRIAEAVHDDTLQVMIAVALRLETLQRSSQDDELREKVGRLVEDTRLAASRLRSLAFDLYPEDLGQGLEVVVRRLLADTAADAGFSYELITDLPKTPPILAARTLYRNIAEAVVNVRKHAEADRVVVEIMADDDGTTARITDDGVGIPEVAANGGAHGHLGLKGLRERTTRAGGRVSIEGGASGGTVVELWVPNTPPAHAG